MKPFFPALLIISACLNRAERQPSSNTTSRPVGPTLALRSALPVNKADTGFWADTSARQGDTVFYHRGRAITSVKVLTDSTWFQLYGIPFGLFAGWNGGNPQPNTDWATLIYNSDNPQTLLTRISYARSHNQHIVFIPTGGARANYLTNGVFDRAKWSARLRTFLPLRDSILAAYQQGVIVALSVLDEPANDGGPGNEGNSWGPKGTLNTTRVDSLCSEAKNLFPGIPAGPFQDWRTFANEWSGQKYRACDFITPQYRVAKGSLSDYKAGMLAEAKRQGLTLSSAINILDGGTPVQKKPGQTDYRQGDCPAGRGTYFPNCRMTGAQLSAAIDTLGPLSCFVTGFRYDKAFVEQNQQSFRDAVTALQNRPRISCLRG